MKLELTNYLIVMLPFAFVLGTMFVLYLVIPDFVKDDDQSFLKIYLDAWKACRALILCATISSVMLIFELLELCHQVYDGIINARNSVIIGILAVYFALLSLYFMNNKYKDIRERKD